MADATDATLADEEEHMTAEWYRVSDDEISWATVVLDARRFAPLFEAQGH